MRRKILPYLLVPFFVCLSFSLPAAPSMPLTGTEEQATTASSAPELQAPLVNLNQVDAITLQRELKGIGKTKAEAIVDYRNTHGTFQSVDELIEIKGIGGALLERNRNRLTIE